MKKFWQCKEKTLKVEVVNSKSFHPKQGTTNNSEPDNQKPPTKNFSLDTLLKSLAFTAVILNSCIAIMGYVDITGYLQAFGIGTNELDLSLSSLLFHGYTEIIVASISSAATYPILGATAVFVVMTCIFIIPVSLILKNQDRVDKSVISMMIGFFVFILLIIPLVGIHRGEERALTLFDKQNKTQVTKELITHHTTITKEGSSISGKTIFASAQHTYILQNREVYKVANSDNHVVSITTLKEIPK
jgi:hypothetical protein